MQYNNFFETVVEAWMRLRGTMVLYGGEPYRVLAVTDHKPDGIWRIYLEPTGEGEAALSWSKYPDLPCSQYDNGHPALGSMMDEWMEKTPDCRVLRKTMNSPLLNRFRPFPLGMANYKESVLYLERQPTRKSEQGLTGSMVLGTALSINIRPGLNANPTRSGPLDIWGKDFLACVKGVYPTVQECLDNLRDPDVVNTAAAFHRQFAFVRGPINSIYVSYKTETVGILQGEGLEALALGREFAYLRETVESLGIFGRVVLS